VKFTMRKQEQEPEPRPFARRPQAAQQVLQCAHRFSPCTVAATATQCGYKDILILLSCPCPRINGRGGGRFRGISATVGRQKFRRSLTCRLLRRPVPFI